MTTKAEYLSEFREPCPDWLERGPFNLRNFFQSRTVFYPGAGGDDEPLATFNPSHSAHCYFFADQRYTATNLDDYLDERPAGYSLWYEGDYVGGAGLARASLRPLTGIASRQFSARPNEPAGSASRSYRSRIDEEAMSGAVDSASAICLRIYERDTGLGDAYGAESFAIFCLGMEARTAYEWFYGTMFEGHPPFAVWLKDHGTGGDFAKGAAGDEGFSDPHGRLYRAARRSGLPEFMVARHGRDCWKGYRWVEGVEPRPGIYGQGLYRRHG